MTREDLNELVRAWNAWDNGPADRYNVIALEQALQPIAAHLDITNSQLRDRITGEKRGGADLVTVVRRVLNLPTRDAA